LPILDLTTFLFSLRDVTQENEQEQRRRIADMEKDVMSVEDLSGMYHSVDHKELGN
jgi:hypothetical protein